MLGERARSRGPQGRGAGRGHRGRGGVRDARAWASRRGAGARRVAGGAGHAGGRMTGQQGAHDVVAGARRDEERGGGRERERKREGEGSSPWGPNLAITVSKT
jgi:hypothetical protein